jgi:hypothetical protein
VIVTEAGKPPQWSAFEKKLEVLAVDDIVIVQKPIGGGLHFMQDLSQRVGKYTLTRTSVDRSFGWA